MLDTPRANSFLRGVNQLDTTSPARDLSFYADAFAVGGLAGSKGIMGNGVFNPVDLYFSVLLVLVIKWKW